MALSTNPHAARGGRTGALVPTLPPLDLCRILVVDPAAVAPDIDRRKWASKLHEERYKHWADDPFATEVWLQRAVMRDDFKRWRTSSVEHADLAFVHANFSLMCVTKKDFSARAIWRTGMPRTAAAGARTGNRTRLGPRVVASLQFKQGCMLPWSTGALLQPDLILVDQILTTSNQARFARRAQANLLTPFVVAQPDWLVSGRVPTSVPRWRDRPLLFFGGHIPKLYVNRLRYQIWRQLRNDERASTQSRTIGCTVGSFEICRRNHTARDRTIVYDDDDDDGSNATHLLRTTSIYHNFCHAQCPKHGGGAAADAPTASPGGVGGDTGATGWTAMREGANRATMGKKRVGADSCIGTFEVTRAKAAAKLRSLCRAYKHVDYGREAEDMQRDVKRSGTRTHYLEAASGHRFCLIAQGDPGNTAKIGETLAIGGSGGCVPVFVLYNARSPGVPPTEAQLLRDYPHLRWLDYCHVAYFITHHVAVNNMSRALDWLGRVSAQEAAAKHAALRRVRPAFVFRADSTLEEPSAAEFMVGEACHRAKAMRKLRDVAPGKPPLLEPLAGGNHARCTLY